MVVISLGSNLGDKEFNIIRAMELIKTNCEIVSASFIFETESWKRDNQDNYLNQIITVKTHLNPDELLVHLLEIESKLGRTRNRKWEPRIIDLDIILFDNVIVNKAGLQIPHPYMHERNFILDIMIDMNLGELIHPVMKKNVNELKKLCSDLASVKKINIKKCERKF